ncbi:MAG TPA: hypothetical protein PKC24_06115 [Cyclobacteriaceae bacterium]|nr:hypothetical protein [Cyclobacteriaceae bacterium]
MKTTLILIISLLAFTVQATVRTVSNNPASIAQFNTIQAAIDASADSDTVYVYGSPNTYDAFTILDKRITVIGPGRAPVKNLPLQALINGASLRDSPAGGSPNGSELHGLVFINTVTLSRNQVGGDLPVNNVRVIRCQFNSTVNWQLSSSGHLFEGNYFLFQLNFTGTSTYENFLFQNNTFFFNVSSLGSSTQINGLTNSVNVRFDHNLFYSNNNSGGSTIAVFGSNCRFLDFSNNIFNQANAGLNVSFSTFTNNLTNNVTLNSANEVSNATPWLVSSNVDGGGNISNQNPQLASQTAVDAGTVSNALDLTVTAGPAIDAGSDGKDLGLLFDATGSLNWANSRNARLPRIFSMNITTPTVSPGGNISVTIDARKSN